MSFFMCHTETAHEKFDALDLLTLLDDVNYKATRDHGEP